VPLVKLGAGAELEVLSQAELNASLQASEERQRQPAKAVSVIRLPVLFGAASGGVLSMGGDSGGPIQSPDQGYVWAIRHLSIEGLVAGATPDVVNVLRAGRIVWKISGAPPSAATFGRGEFMVNAGETLTYTNFGTFASTAPIVISGTAWQCPAQFVAELGL
jgi:hypothetical protein